MYLQADVHCYHCGDIPGIWEWRAGQPAGSGRFQPFGSGTPYLGRHTGLRCGRCQGPTYLDDVRPQPRQRPRCVFERGRPGRPPKSRERLFDGLAGDALGRGAARPLAG